MGRGGAKGVATRTVSGMLIGLKPFSGFEAFSSDLSGHFFFLLFFYFSVFIYVFCLKLFIFMFYLCFLLFPSFPVLFFGRKKGGQISSSHARKCFSLLFKLGGCKFPVQGF
jgi:hypothetical protein